MSSQLLIGGVRSSSTFGWIVDVVNLCLERLVVAGAVVVVWLALGEEQPQSPTHTDKNLEHKR